LAAAFASSSGGGGGGTKVRKPLISAAMQQMRTGQENIPSKGRVTSVHGGVRRDGVFGGAAHVQGLAEPEHELEINCN
jgi:hypothetical protein